MTCHFCGAETEDVVETDLPLGRGKQLEYKKIGICKKKRCRKMLERRLNGGDTSVQVSAMSGKKEISKSASVAQGIMGRVGE